MELCARINRDRKLINLETERKQWMHRQPIRVHAVLTHVDTRLVRQAARYLTSGMERSL